MIKSLLKTHIRFRKYGVRKGAYWNNFVLEAKKQLYLKYIKATVTIRIQISPINTPWKLLLFMNS